VDPAAPDGDLAFLGPLVGNARVVGLGEAAHGGSEFFRMKHRMFRYLVERQGFNAFGLEADLGICRDLDAYVLTGNGDPRRILAEQVLWPWRAEEVLDLVTWMRAYNADPAHARKLRFFGFDMQEGHAALRDLRRMVAGVEPGLLPALEMLVGLYEPYLHVPQVYWNVSAAVQHQCKGGLLGLVNVLEANHGHLAEKGGAEAADWILRLAEVLVQHEAMHSAWAFPRSLMAENLRDRYMADNADWMLAHLEPGTSVVLWAHNGHVNRRGTVAPLWTNTGEWLARRHGAAYLAVGFAFGSGRVNAIPSQGQDALGGPRAHALDKPEEGSVEAALLEADLKLAFLDLRRMDLTDAGAAWFAEPQAFREVGATYGPEDLDGKVLSRLPERFDLLVFLKEVTPSNLFGGY
jgi:erythromycin esterase